MMEKQLDMGALKGKKGFSKRGVSKPREVKCGVFWRPYKSFLNSNQSAGKQRSGDGFNVGPGEMVSIRVSIGPRVYDDTGLKWVCLLS